MMISFSNWASWVWPIVSEPEAMPSDVYPIMAQLAFGQELGHRNRLNQCDLQIRHRSNLSTEHSDQINQMKQMAIWCSKRYRKDVDASLVMLCLVILTISRSKSLSDQTSSIVYCYWAFAKDTEPTAERRRKTFVGFINSKFE
jgi:hypothetical protein